MRKYNNLDQMIKEYTEGVERLNKDSLEGEHKRLFGLRAAIEIEMQARRIDSIFKLIPKDPEYKANKAPIPMNLRKEQNEKNN